MSEAKREIDPRHLEAATDALLGIEFRDEAHMNAAHILVANALANAESAQPAERAGEWVSVEERLPDEADPVLCRVEGDLPTVGFYRSHDKPLHWAAGWWSRNGHALAGVTHWMPLPPPPQPKEKP